jgi:hypothetical protein
MGANYDYIVDFRVFNDGTIGICISQIVILSSARMISRSGDGEAGEQIFIRRNGRAAGGFPVSLWREEKQKAKPLSPLNFHPATLR